MFSQDHTPEKLKDYQSFLQMHIAVSRAIQQKHDYINPVRFHFELNGGPGMHVQIDAKFEGTPAIAAREFWNEKIRYIGCIFEQDPRVFDALSYHLDKVPHNFVLYKNDYTDILLDPIFQSDVPKEKWRLGLIVSDECGAAIPFRLLKSLAERWPQVDILIHATATGLKRARGVKPQEYLTLHEGLSLIGKRHWQIRTYAGKWQWCWLFGTNWRGHPLLRKTDYHWAHTPKGQQLLAHLSKTSREREDV